MTNATQPKPNPLPAILVYGTPSGPALTQASWFRAEDKETVKSAAEALNPMRTRPSPPERMKASSKGAAA